MKGTLSKKLSGLVITSILATSIFVPHENSIASAASTTATDKSTNVADAKFVNDFRSVKKNVKKYNEWSKFKRVSDDVKTKNHTGSITSDRTVSWSGSVTGDVKGLSYSLGKTVTSSVNYTLNVPKYTNVYMGYRVKYAVEEGENHRIDIVTGKTISKKKYKIKKTMNGQYQLVEN
ncbi:hypothetical protein ACFY5J_25045 [Peribacillus butanolivorans]|uniref:hypothetical protein n=1 Tax=Peribacillus butanolivorans TaxID=421767 RepID=UPI003695BAC4